MAQGTPEDELSRAVGEVCLWWSYIEARIKDICVEASLAMQAAADDGRTRRILEVWTSNIDMRQAILVAKGLLARHWGAANPYSECEKILNRLDSDHRPERNRYIHDMWAVSASGVTRTKTGTVITRPQSRQVLAEFLKSKEFSGIEGVREFSETLAAEYDGLGAILAKIRPIQSGL